MLDEIEIEDEGGDEEGGSWYSRAKSGGRTFGALAILLGSLYLLFWNEGFSKRHSDAIAEAGELVVAAPRDVIDPALEGKPVHLSARVNSQAGTADEVFGLRTKGVALYRHVLMFQWIEYEEKSGRGKRKRTEYVYAMDWDDTYHDSSKFHEPAGHQNPKPALESDGFFAQDARFGPYRFDNDEVAAQALDDMETPNAPGSLGRWPTELTALPELSSELQQKRWYKLDEGTYYRGNAATDEAELGDLSVTFYELSNDYALSMIGAQKGDHLEAWTASNGDSVLLASGGTHSADQIISDAAALGDSRTKFLRIVGLIGAVIGAAGIGRLLAGFLGMIPVVGSIVQYSLMVTGAIFGLLVGLVTIAVGWLSARPWIAGTIMALIIGGIVWMVLKGRGAEGRKKRLAKVARVAAIAKQRAAERLAMPAAPTGLATAGGGMPPPPPPPGSSQPSRFTGKASIGPMHPIDSDPSKDLAPLEWTPGLAPKAPPAVKQPPPKPLIPPALVEPPKTPPVRKPNPFDAVDDTKAAAPPPPSPTPARAAFTIGAAPPAGVQGAAWFEAVEPLSPAAPRFASVDAPAVQSPPLFDTVEAFSKPKPLFDELEAFNKPAPLFDTVEPAAQPKPLFDTFEPVTKPRPLFDDDLPAAKPAPLFDEPPPPAPVPAPVVAAAPIPPTRISLGSKGDYGLNKIVRKAADGTEELICYELMHHGKPIQRGTQEQIKLAFKEALAKG